MMSILPSVATQVMVTGSLSASEEQDTLNAGGMREGERDRNVSRDCYK